MFGIFDQKSSCVEGIARKTEHVRDDSQSGSFTSDQSFTSPCLLTSRGLRVGEVVGGRNLSALVLTSLRATHYDNKTVKSVGSLSLFVRSHIFFIS